MGRTRSPRRRRGFALLVVLMVTVLLEILVADLALYSWLSLKSARNFSRDLQNVAAVDGVLRAAAEVLASDELSPKELRALLQGGLQGLALGEAVVTVAFEDEGGKLNLNLLAEPNPVLAEMARAELLALFDALGLDSSLAQRIAEFVRGGEFSPDEAATEEPQGISLLEELRLVEGVTDELLFGSTGADAQEAPVLSRYVSCWGRGQVNVNTAPPEVLHAVLDEVHPGLTDRILQSRSSQALASVGELEGFLDLAKEGQERLVTRLTTESDTYSLTVTSRSGDLAALTQAVLEIGPDARGTVLLCKRRQ